MYKFRKRNPESRIANPHAGGGERDGEARKNPKIRFQKIAEFVRIERVSAETDAKGVQNRVARRIGLTYFVKPVRENVFGLERHRSKRDPM